MPAAIFPAAPGSAGSSPSQAGHACWPESNIKNNDPGLIEPIAVGIIISRPKRALSTAAIRSHSSKGTEVTSPQDETSFACAAGLGARQSAPFDNSDSLNKSSGNQELG